MIAARYSDPDNPVWHALAVMTLYGPFVLATLVAALVAVIVLRRSKGSRWRAVTIAGISAVALLVFGSVATVAWTPSYGRMSATLVFACGPGRGVWTALKLPSDDDLRLRYESQRDGIQWALDACY